MNKIHRWLCASSFWKQALEDKLLPWVFDGVDLGDELLEIGPGPGLTTDSLRQKVQQMTALEIDHRLADSLKQRLQGSNVNVIEGSAADMPFANDSFSSVVSLTMLHHVPSMKLQDRLFSETYRVLRPGGCFVGTDSKWSLLFGMLHIGDTMVMVDPETLGARLEALGFKNVKIDRGKHRFRFRAHKR